MFYLVLSVGSIVVTNVSKCVVDVQNDLDDKMKELQPNSESSLGEWWSCVTKQGNHSLRNWSACNLQFLWIRKNYKQFEYCS